MRSRTISCVLALFLLCTILTLLATKRGGGKSQMISWLPPITSLRNRFFIWTLKQLHNQPWHRNMLSDIFWYTPMICSAEKKSLSLQIKEFWQIFFPGWPSWCSKKTLYPFLSQVWILWLKYGIYLLTSERMCFTLRLPAEPDVHQANPHGRPRVRPDQEVNSSHSLKSRRQ